MEANRIDPRVESSLEENPDYRVDFWGPIKDGGGRVVADGSDEWLLTGVRDVHEALGWANDKADGRSFVLYARFHDGQRIGVARLVGEEPF
ncbi:MAG: hypothetical protein ACQEXN_15540 [Actinomycetota bacterium]